jgi:phosphomannomutase/phosphoglucomutase
VLLEVARLFGTDGVRGLVNEQLTPEMALRLGAAIATYFGEGSRILVGRDVRAGGDMLVSAVVAGLLSAGARVYYAGYAPTPAIQYAVRAEGYDGGVIVTASHNPPEYNGVKVVGPTGIEVERDAERRIEEIYFEQRFRRVPWTLLLHDVRRDDAVVDLYVKAVVDSVDSEAIRRRGFKVVVDCANSVTALTTPYVLRSLGVRVVSVNCHLDPLFPGREPEPTPATLAETARIVRELGADLGVGHDGDGDRAILIDERGTVWWGDRSGTLLAAYAAEKMKDAPRRVYTAVSSSTLVEEYLRSYGIEVRWTPVGAVNISYALLREGGVAGFEENGGYIHPPHQLVRDGAMKVALFLEMMVRENARASQLFARLPAYYAVKTKIPMSRELAVKAVEEVKRMFEGYRMVTIDGVKVFGEGWWVLVRPSGTEPVLRIMVEARTPEEAKRLADQVSREVARRVKRG